MCGIAGAIFTSNSPAAREDQREQAREILSQMVRNLTHRGPDDRGAETMDCNDGGTVALGHTRLSIIDLSAAGHQPMTDPHTGNCIVFNGEIYNYRELRNRLADEFNDWHSETDTEVILKAYHKWGAECVSHLRGMFAFALWDAGRQCLFIARDRLGIKPLYFSNRDGVFLFASEVRAILASGCVPRRIDRIALDEYLGYQSIPTPRSLIEGIRVLLPGCAMTVNNRGEIETHEYWNLLRNYSDEAAQATPAEARRRVGALLRGAVESHLVSDVPLGAFLSGGIDSSAVVALMRELGVRPKSFSVVFEEAAFDEAAYARQIAERFQADHTEIRLTEQALLDQLPEALAAMDQPTGDGVNTYVVSKAVKQAGITVALSGLGGDEFFGGYSSFQRLEKAVKLLRPGKHLPGVLKTGLAGIARLLGGQSVQANKLASMIESDGSTATLYPITRRVLSAEQRNALLGEFPERGEDPYIHLLRDAFESAPHRELLTQISYAEARTYMHDVLLRDTDQMSMAHALEVRVPLLDHELVEYVMGLPDVCKRVNGTPKQLLVESLKGLLPREIVHRPKRGFTLPFAKWMPGALRGECEARLERLAERRLVDAREVRRLWQAFLRGAREVSWSRLWVLVVLEDWLERNEIIALKE